MIYGGKMGIDTAFGNIWMKDSVNQLVISGQKAVYNRNTSIAVVTKHPLASVLMDGDSLHIAGDTLRSTSDSLKRKSIYAFHHVRFFGKDLQGICDSLHYSQIDSMIYMEKDPVLWNETRQMRADSIHVRVVKGKVERADFIDKAMIIEEVDTLLYNQISGNLINAWFTEKHLREVYVQGNAENIYYQEEEAKEPGDTSVLTSMNYVICTDIRLRFDTAGKAEEILYIEKPEGTDYPINQLPGGEKQQLKGFDWRVMERPGSKADLRR